MTNAIRHTDEQLKIIEISKRMQSGEILKINACAGSGKTTMLKEVALANPDKTFLYLAFNKSIVEESKNKFPKNVKLQTVHSLAYQAVIAPRKAKVVSSYNVFDFMKYLPFKDYQEAQIFQADLTHFLNSALPLSETSDDVRMWFKLVEIGEIPYTHNLYLKSYQLMTMQQENLSEKYDFVLLDEAQDTNKVTLSIFLNNSCKKILVGDVFQNIYGFRETINALSNEVLKADYNCNLSFSFRCPQNILDKAYFFLNKYALDGQKPLKMKSGVVDNGDEQDTRILITRLNASIVKIIYDTLTDSARNMRYSLLKNPSDLLESSIAVYWFLKNRRDKIPYSYAWIKKFSDESELYSYADKSGDQELKSSIDNAENYDIRLFDILDEAKRIYKRKDEFDKYLTNAHLSKGLEFSEVSLHNDFLPLKAMQNVFINTVSPTEKKKLFLAIIQEKNLYYVAMTRAKKKLIDFSENHKEFLSIMDNTRTTVRNSYKGLGVFLNAY